MTPYGLISDTHHHNWSAFATTNADGVNGRLATILDETERAAAEVAKVGGKLVVHAGDLFHVRGSIAPSVLVPTRDRYAAIHQKYGTEFLIDAGNHDLEGKHSSRLGNAVEAMRCDYIRVISEPTQVAINGAYLAIMPWYDKVADLQIAIGDMQTKVFPLEKTDLIIHAPIDGVIVGLPPHGLTPEWLASLGFRRVFGGHYHNSKAFPGGVVSIGALTHQTWSDVGSLAGFYVVSDAGESYFPSMAPRFVEIARDTKPDEIEALVKGNYVRAKMNSPKPAEVLAMQQLLEKMGAKGIRIDVVKESARVRAEGVTVKAGSSIEVSIGDYVKAQKFPNEAQVTIEALKVLAEAA